MLHYTELPLGKSLDILCDAKREHRVSAHYVVAEDGTVYRLVPEDRVAWHAGKSWWRGREALNGTSIGIEIVNLWGDANDYPEPQVAALIELCHGQAMQSQSGQFAGAAQMKVYLGADSRIGVSAGGARF